MLAFTVFKLIGIAIQKGELQEVSGIPPSAMPDSGKPRLFRFDDDIMVKFCTVVAHDKTIPHTK